MNPLESAYTIALTTREKTAMLLFIVSIGFVVFSVFTNFLFEASGPMMAVSFAACLFSVLPILSILAILKKKKNLDLGFNRSKEEQDYKLKRINNSVRAPVVVFGLLMLLFTIGSALIAYEIYEPDIPGGIILAFSGFLALGGATFYQREIPSDMQFSYLPPPPPPSTHTKEIIREKEVIVKIRCQYCGNTFDETLDQCTTCGAKK